MTTAWEPHTVIDEAVVETVPLAAFQALVDDGLPILGAGDELPPLWHWLALPSWSPSSVLGTDGHPRRGSFLPPIELPRRMFAGGEVTLHAPIAIGSVVRREADVAGVEHKSGRSGDLVVVTTRTRLYHAATLCLEERQDLIFRGDAPRDPAAALPERPVASEPAVPLTQTAERVWRLRTDPTLLMRFSAATANAHRIHYDWPYATGVEGYPGLVVHGPLMTLLLAETARLAPPRGRITRLAHRNRAPLFCGQDAELRLTADAEEPERLVAELVSADTVCTSLTLTTERAA